MITLRRNKERRRIQRGKQEIWNTFYPEDHPGLICDGFGSMVVFDEMRLSPGDSTEPNRGDEAEMVTYIYKGALSQEDSTGNSGVIRTGEFQSMSMGHRIRHKERNALRSDWTHVFRISLRPLEVGLDCAHEEKLFTAAQRRNELCVVASPDGRKGSLRIHQDALVYSSVLDAGHHVFHELPPGRAAWLHIVHGEAMLNDIVLTQGDGVGVTNEPSVSLTVQENTELLLVDTILNSCKHHEWKET
ncbi:MAG: pirin family protein [Syntrophaceae bacterium]|nr:pirin family protein [Syntrophaceae bacterium]